MSFWLLCWLWTSVWPLLQLFCLSLLNIDLFRGGSYEPKWRGHAFLACCLPLWPGLYLMFFIRLALDSSNLVKICLDSSSRIFEPCPLVSLYSLLTTLNKAMPSVSSLPQDYFAVLVCSSFSWGQHYSVLALNIADSPTLVFISIVPGQFEQVLPN